MVAGSLQTPQKRA